jgi:orotidine-5'-phosphate decarboxylase
MEGLGKLNVDLVNVHAAGGTEMMKHAVKGLRKYNEIIQHCFFNRRLDILFLMKHFFSR